MKETLEDAAEDTQERVRMMLVMEELCTSLGYT